METVEEGGVPADGQVSPPAEYRGNIQRQILTANDIPRWEKNDAVVIAGYVVVCKNETSPLHDRSQHLVRS